MEEYLPSIFTIITALALAIFLNHMFKKRKIIPRDKIIQQIIIFLIILTGIVIAIFALPTTPETKQSILSFLGIVIGAAIALSSTTFIANAMSGIMLKFIKPFKVGDYIKTENVFGRVSDIQILHTQVQSIDRDFITVPNLKLVSNPLKTIRSTGTIINATVSLGYDIPRKKIEENLIKAAKETGLENPFVHIIDLGDHSVTYKVGGLLRNIEFIVTTRSDFRKKVMDILHDEMIEIVSPTFMNQRVLKDEAVFIPPKEHKPEKEVKELEEEKKPEEMIFDKAIIAESVNKIEKKFIQLEEKRKEEEQKIFGILILPEAKEARDMEIRQELKEDLDTISQEQKLIKVQIEALNKVLKEEEEAPAPEMIITILKSMETKLDEMKKKQKEIDDQIQKITEKEISDQESSEK